MVTQPPDPEQRLHTALRMAGLGIKHMYRIDEVARLFDTSRDTIYRMIEEAELTGVRVRASFRVDYLALVAKFSEEDL